MESGAGRVCGIIVMMSAFTWPCSASAQESMTEVLSFLLTNRSIPTDDFVQDQQAAAAARDAISDGLLRGLTTLPTATSAGGFTYRVEEALGGIPIRSSNSFGGFFTERAFTAGERRGAVGAGYQRIAFDALDGRNLRDGTLVATASSFEDDPAPFDVETLTLRIHTDTLMLSGNYGLTDRLDVGATLPITRVTLRGQRINTYRGRALPQALASAEATGFGDVALRVKYNVLRSLSSGVAVGAEVRLPTGREEDLLGTGEVAVKPRVIWSAQGRRVTVDTDIGYLTGGLSDELNYGGAVTVLGGPRVTVTGEVAGRLVGSAGRITEMTAPHPGLSDVQTIRLSALDETSHRMIAIGGIKWNPAGTLLVGGNVQRRMTNAGLTAGWALNLAIEYSLGG